MITAPLLPLPVLPLFVPPQTPVILTLSVVEGERIPVLAFAIACSCGCLCSCLHPVLPKNCHPFVVALAVAFALLAVVIAVAFALLAVIPEGDLRLSLHLRQARTSPRTLNRATEPDFIHGGYGFLSPSSAAKNNPLKNPSKIACQAPKPLIPNKTKHFPIAQQFPPNRYP
jgi:hypothetical protein